MFFLLVYVGKVGIQKLLIVFLQQWVVFVRICSIMCFCIIEVSLIFFNSRLGIRYENEYSVFLNVCYYGSSQRYQVVCFSYVYYLNWNYVFSIREKYIDCFNYYERLGLLVEFLQYVFKEKRCVGFGLVYIDQDIFSIVFY